MLCPRSVTSYPERCAISTKHSRKCCGVAVCKRLQPCVLIHQPSCLGLMWPEAPWPLSERASKVQYSELQQN